jgi:hypothetical protein
LKQFSSLAENQLLFRVLRQITNFKNFFEPDDFFDLISYFIRKKLKQLWQDPLEIMKLQAS